MAKPSGVMRNPPSGSEACASKPADTSTRSGANASSTGTAIGYAVAVGAPLPLIQMLLNAGADPLRVINRKLPMGASALTLAVTSKNKEALDAILATLKPGELSEARHFEVLDSLMRVDSASMRRALDSGFKVNAKGTAGFTMALGRNLCGDYHIQQLIWHFASQVGRT